MAVSSVAPKYSDTFLESVNGKPKAVNSTDTTASADRFLKLLVTQMQNQDPLNPMDNAQVTTQMAQINTVTGIDKLNSTVQSLSGQFSRLQSLQAASLVGTDVVVPGNKLAVTDGLGQGGFELSGPADQVKVEILSAGGQVLGTMNLGAQGSGVHAFSWDGTTAGATDDSGLKFRVSATLGSVTSTASPLMRDRVDAVRAGGNDLNLELRNAGTVAYDQVRAFN